MGFDPEQDPLLRRAHSVILLSVRALVVLMTLVIVWGVVDVIWVLYERLRQPPVMLLTISDILSTFGAFIAVMIAIEIFENLTIYLRRNVIAVELVMATALMAIARKVIVLDYKQLSPGYVWATGGVVLAMSIGYWLVKHQHKTATGSPGQGSATPGVGKNARAPRATGDESAAPPPGAPESQ